MEFRASLEISGKSSSLKLTKWIQFYYLNANIFNVLLQVSSEAFSYLLISGQKFIWRKWDLASM